MNPADLEQAACKKMHPDVFFPKTEEGVEVATTVCFRCPVRERCLENAVANHIQFGVFGGYTAKQRRRRFAKPENVPVRVTPKNPAAKVCPSCEATGSAATRHAPTGCTANADNASTGGKPTGRRRHEKPREHR
jgi:WhiB family redox-sensing transcriptional regulator